MATFDFVSNPDVIIPEEDYREAERLGMDVHSYRAAKAFEEEHPIGEDIDIVPYTEANRDRSPHINQRRSFSLAPQAILRRLRSSFQSF